MSLLKEIKACDICIGSIPFSPKPILQFGTNAETLIVGQAPGIRAHETEKPWNDASGMRLREWLNISAEDFYNPRKFAIVPMGFCYPGKGKTGDLPPRKECSVRWMDSILCDLTQLKRIVLVGSYSANYFLGLGPLTDKIQEHATSISPFIVLPHPSPRNNIWLSKNLWFEREYLENIRQKFITLSSI